MRINKLLVLSFLITLLLTLTISSVSAADYTTAYLQETLLNQDPDPAEPGKYLELRWKIVKSGNTVLDDITYALEVEHPFSFDASDTPVKNLGDFWGKSDDETYYILYYKVKVDSDAIEGDYKVKLRQGDANSGGSSVEEYTIRVGNEEVPKFALGSLTTSPTKLVSDTEEAQLNIELENYGDGDAQNVNVELKLPEGLTSTYGYSNRDNLGTISSGGSDTAIFYVDVDENVESEIINAEIVINYKEENDENSEYKELILPLEIPIKNKPTFEILSVKNYPDIIYPGDDVELRIQLKNTGSKEAESVSLRAFKDASHPIEFEEKYDFVGNLKEDEMGEAVLTFTVDKDAVYKNYKMDLEVRSVSNDEVLIEEETITFMIGKEGEITKKNMKINVSYCIVALILIIAAGFIGYFIGKKKAMVV